MPGFYDSHVHLLGSGLRLAEVALKDAQDEAEFGKRLRAFDRKLPRQRWLLGGEWDHDRTFAGRLPTAELIDKYVADRPVFLRRYDGHMAVVNSRVLQLAGITKDTPDPAGGVIYRKPGSRQPSGVLRDNAMSLVERLLPRTTEAEIIEAVRAALAEARKVGVTSVQDMDGSGTATRRRLFRLYQQLARQGKLTTRIDLRWPLADWRSLAALGVEANFGDDWVRIGGVKGFVDGSLGSSTAKMFEPYLHEKGNTGVYVTPLTRLREQIEGADAAGLSIAVHAIGDRANAELLDIFAEVAKKNGPRDRRFRIEHAQHLRPQDYGRFKELNVIASLQPYHAIDDGRWAEGRIGGKRCASSYAVDRCSMPGHGWRSAPTGRSRRLIRCSASTPPSIAAHSMASISMAGFPNKRFASPRRSTAYTLGSAYAAFQEKERGSLEVGKLADLVVLSRDILAEAERDRIAATEVLLTIVGGKIVYEKMK